MKRVGGNNKEYDNDNDSVHGDRIDGGDANNNAGHGDNSGTYIFMYASFSRVLCIRFS